MILEYFVAAQNLKNPIITYSETLNMIKYFCIHFDYMY